MLIAECSPFVLLVVSLNNNKKYLFQPEDPDRAPCESRYTCLTIHTQMELHEIFMKHTLNYVPNKQTTVIVALFIW